ncbi:MULTISPECIES: hypothetical protein [Paenibacillus]|uniref:hypothetical protein n=1 Tax=Paenibacillus TaxID=44249 RepID=UPI0022B88A4C|nr:hypothetical protein [Paenibacillus caseinilyticus]MCZ8520983.1 hypothetical protein [Paenibacillus caseinilyticus]
MPLLGGDLWAGGWTILTHLTLGKTKWGMNEIEIIEMKLAAREALSPFPSFDVTFVRVLDIIKNTPFEDIKLAMLF